jgi:hypothetical protein
MKSTINKFFYVLTVVMVVTWLLGFTLPVVGFTSPCGVAYGPMRAVWLPIHRCYMLDGSGHISNLSGIR